MRYLEKLGVDTFKAEWLVVIIAVGLITPSLVRVILEVSLGHVSPFASIRHMVSWQFSEGDNMVGLAILGLIPFGALSGILIGLPRKLTKDQFSLFAALGLMGILAYMIPAHVSIWLPLYSGLRMSSTAVIAFLFIPFYCLGTMVIGVTVAAIAILGGHWCRCSRPKCDRMTTPSP